LHETQKRKYHKDSNFDAHQRETNNKKEMSEYQG